MRRASSFALWIMIAALAAPALAGAPYSGLGASSVSKEVLERFAPKPVPEEIARHIQAMFDVRSPGLGLPSPDGSRLFFGWRVTGVPQVWRLDGPDRFPIQLTGGEDNTSVDGITPDGKTLVIERDRNGEENPGLYTMSANGGPLSAIQHVPGVQTIFDFVSPDGKWVYFHANDQKQDSYAIYRWSFATRRRQLVFAEPGLWSVGDSKPDGRLLLRKETGSLSTEYAEWNPVKRTLTPLLGQGEKVEYTARYGVHDGELIVLTPKFGEFRRAYSFVAGKFTPISPELKWDVASIDVDDARRHVFYTVNEAGYTRLAVLDASTFAPVPMPALPRGADHVYPGETTRDGRFTTLGVETATAPRTNFVCDWTTGALRQWVVPSAPEVNTSAFAPAKLEYCTARDGTRIPLFVRRPATCGSGPCPVVVLFHGGPEGQAQPGFNTFAQLFVDAGYVMVEPNVRGSDGYGKAWLDADNGAKRLQIITDIEDVARHVRRAFSVNGRAPRVGVLGGSYGGYSALMAMTRFAGAYDAGVSIVGISNLITFLNNTAPYRRILRTTEYGDPDKDRDALIQLSPITHVGRLKAPLMIIQGANDPRVPVGEAVQMYEAARKTSVPTELIIFPDEGHGAGKRANQVLQLGYALRWFKEYLRGTGAVAARETQARIP